MLFSLGFAVALFAAATTSAVPFASAASSKEGSCLVEEAILDGDQVDATLMAEAMTLRTELLQSKNEIEIDSGGSVQIPQELTNRRDRPAAHASKSESVVEDSQAVVEAFGAAVAASSGALAASSRPHFYHRPNDTTFNLSLEYQILHVGKTGGSSLTTALANITDLTSAEMLGHTWSRKATQTCTMREPKNKYIFFVRAPIARYVSAWISRFRYGAPGQPNPDWTEGEIIAFETFASPDELACALSSSNSTTRRQAKQAMMDIVHVNRDINWYWNGRANLEDCIDQVFFVGRTEHFADDIGRLGSKLHDEGVIFSLPPVPLEHETTDEYAYLEPLGPCAVTNLRNWYHRDYEIIDFLASAGKLNASYPGEVDLIDVPTKA